MAEKRFYGLKELNAAEVSADGSMPTLLKELCRTYRGSAEFTEDDAQIKEEFCDQEDDAIEIFKTKGAKQVKFSTFDYSNEALVALRGGTIVDEKWAEPTDSASIYRAIELVTKNDGVFQFPKCLVLTKFNAKFVQDGVILLEVILKPMSPGKGKSALFVGSKK